MEVLDGGRRRRYCPDHLCRLQSAAPLHIGRCGACSNRRSQTTVRSPTSKPLPGCPFVRRHVREADNRNRTALRSQAGRRSDRAPHVHSSRCHGGTPVRSRCVGNALSAPITVNNSGIDARNGQAYHGRKTIATNGTPPTALGSRAKEGQRVEERQRRQLASCVRPCPRAASRTRVL
jgi:hypothetical protein